MDQVALAIQENIAIVPIFDLRKSNTIRYASF